MDSDDDTLMGAAIRMHCGCFYYDADSCRSKAVEVGMIPGTMEYEFEKEGDEYSLFHGCYYFPETDSSLPNVAFFTTGDHPISMEIGPYRTVPGTARFMYRMLCRNTYLDAESCRARALELNLLPGAAGFEFATDSSTKGCYYYPPDHPEFANMAFFGTVGTDQDMRYPIDGRS